METSRYQSINSSVTYFQKTKKTYLAEVKQILEDGNLPELQAVGDGVTHHEGGHKVLKHCSLFDIFLLDL